MTQIRKVQEFVKKFVKEYGKLDVLINNAGEKCETFQKTKADNLERNFATNVMGPYVLTTGLIPILKKSPNNPRVVNYLLRLKFIFCVMCIFILFLKAF